MASNDDVVVHAARLYVPPPTRHDTPWHIVSPVFKSQVATGKCAGRERMRLHRLWKILRWRRCPITRARTPWVYLGPDYARAIGSNAFARAWSHNRPVARVDVQYRIGLKGHSFRTPPLVPPEFATAGWDRRVFRERSRSHHRCHHHHVHRLDNFVQQAAPRMRDAMISRECDFFSNLVHALFGMLLMNRRPPIVATDARRGKSTGLVDDDAGNDGFSDDDVVTLCAHAGFEASEEKRERLVRYYHDTMGFDVCVQSPSDDVAYAIRALDKCGAPYVGMHARVARLLRYHEDAMRERRKRTTHHNLSVWTMNDKSSGEGCDDFVVIAPNDQVQL